MGPLGRKYVKEYMEGMRVESPEGPIRSSSCGRKVHRRRYWTPCETRRLSVWSSCEPRRRRTKKVKESKVGRVPIDCIFVLCLSFSPIFYFLLFSLSRSILKMEKGEHNYDRLGWSGTGSGCLRNHYRGCFSSRGATNKALRAACSRILKITVIIQDPPPGPHNL